MAPLTRFARLFGGGETSVVPAREAYALWAPVYPPRPHNALMAAEQGVMAPILAACAPARALDVGTGSGRWLSVIAATGARVIGIDRSLPMLTAARAGHGGEVLPGPWAGTAPARVCADACRLPFRDATFDLVSSSLMAGDLVDVQAFAREASRVLEPGGDLVYSDFHPAWAERGWRRTFRAADGRDIEIAYSPHSLDHHLTALDTCGFDVRAIREPRLAVPGGGDAPVVIVFHAVRRALANGVMVHRRTRSPR